jgi:carboxyl-terminal processing protease
MKKLLLIAGLALVFFTACKKSKPAEETQTTTTTATSLDLIKDSVFLYAKEDYYWYDGLPDYNTFNPRATTGSDDLTALTNEVNKISQYKINTLTGLPYEYYSASPGQAKYSFIDEGETSTRLSAVTGDFGFAPLYTAGSLTDLRIKYVYPGSPADLAGIKRGYQITSINGRTALTYDGSSGTNVNFIVNAYANSSTITMILAKPDKTTMTVTLNTATYKVNPILATKVIDAGAGKKVGYICFNSFVSLTSTQAALTTAFNTFTTAGITDLVVDLRYNGGGYVETAQFLDNLIAPTAANGKLMYNTYYNATLAANKETLLKNQWRRDDNGTAYNYSQIDFSVAGNTANFAKSGTLNLSRVFFIVTSSTASASELTINNLRPYMNVQLIGSTSYGKPVGFFDIDISKYKMYIPEFETKNSAGQGGYYSGMKPGSTDYPGVLAVDDPTHDFGDTAETLFAEAISYVTKGTYSTSSLAI